MLQNIRIVLAETSHTGNMGSVTRAIKTMGLTNPWLANPLAKPDSQATTFATDASDVTGNAQIVDTLDEALADCSLVVSINACPRALPWPMLDPRGYGPKGVAEGQHAPVVLVLGCERVGLTNEELQRCHYHVVIAANPEYSSLNLVMAVQIIAYEVWMARLAMQEQTQPAVGHEETPHPLVGDLERLYGHLEQTLLVAGFIRPNHLGQVMNKPCRLFIHVHPESQELNILRGMLASIEQQGRGKQAR